MESLFSARERELQQRFAPLAERMRPRTLDEIVGQTHLLGPGALLRGMIEEDRLVSLILWGPPGCGKTTIARVIAEQTRAAFVPLSAVTATVADVRRAVHEARERLGQLGQRTIVFIDEIHRFNRAQQDALLPAVEDGTIVLIGATTENPSFEVNAPLLSRCRVVVLEPLSDEAIRSLLERALTDTERGLGGLAVEVEPEALEAIVNLANGDARMALNTLELAVTGARRGRVTVDIVRQAAMRRATVYDRVGDVHYDTISALHKAIRGSDPDAALYWLARMLENGEDPLFIARRLVRAASEDIGLADPHALVVAVAAQQAVHVVGLPEGALALAQAAVYLALAPKSNALYRAYEAARRDVAETRNDPVPLHLRNAPTALLRQLGWGAGYRYPHDEPDGIGRQEYLPPRLRGRRYYEPTERGWEARVRERLAAIRARRNEPGERSGADEERP
ncbi:replication-associated recombination protein A [Thermomicrobium sp. 4228-Ro]|nr:replication-associated recombination protein A [Thermomicrobium sp. 4228-Ro]MCX2726436.1 replication-associated recombination protein A [Thermomicrobium sp. 4228-Ro]